MTTITRVVIGIILAAGQSSRMGRSKALLPLGPGGATFVAHLAGVLGEGGVNRVAVVGRIDDADLALEVARGGVRVGFFENADADRGGQLSSVLAGVAVAEATGAEAMLVVPVDVPLVTAATVARLLEDWRRSAAPIVRAVYRGRHGHPVLFARRVFDELRRADPAAGARAVVRANGPAVLNVEVNDPGVVEDVDTPADYRRVFGVSL